MLREQGGVVVEPIYNKVYDFAMEFRSDGQGRVVYEGLSRFFTTSRGTYAGNRVVSEEEHVRWLTSFVPYALWETLRDDLTAYFSRVLDGGYRGPFGVDMMLCRVEGSGELSVHPCVEVNLRMNMGLLACKLQRRIMAPGVIGQFAIECFPVEGDLLHRHEADMVEHPLRVSHGRLLSGYLPLVPVCRESRYRAYVMAGRGDWPTWPGREDSHCRTCP